MSPLHPFTVHLPIGLLIGNAIMTILYLRRGDRSMETAAYHCLWLGWLLLLPAVVTGTIDAARQVFDPTRLRDETLIWVNAHALTGIAIMVVYWQAWQARRRNPAILNDARTRRGYLTLLALGVALVMLTGWLGGQLVYTLHLGIKI
ncbi:MAG: DUF2231 domain-containing protein [Roseiflexus sp.]